MKSWWSTTPRSSSSRISVLFLHAHNPWGFANAFRCTKENVDLTVKPTSHTGELASRLPQRLPRPLRPCPVILVTVDAVLAHVGEDLSRCRQAPGVDALVRILQVGTHNGRGRT